MIHFLISFSMLSNYHDFCSHGEKFVLNLLAIPVRNDFPNKSVSSNSHPRYSHFTTLNSSYVGRIEFQFASLKIQFKNRFAKYFTNSRVKWMAVLSRRCIMSSFDILSVYEVIKRSTRLIIVFVLHGIIN